MLVSSKFCIKTFEQALSHQPPRNLTSSVVIIVFHKGVEVCEYLRLCDLEIESWQISIVPGLEWPVPTVRWVLVACLLHIGGKICNAGQTLIIYVNTHCLQWRVGRGVRSRGGRVR